VAVFIQALLSGLDLRTRSAGMVLRAVSHLSTLTTSVSSEAASGVQVDAAVECVGLVVIHRLRLAGKVEVVHLIRIVVGFIPLNFHA
jgi:hypothetical protein